MFACFKRKDLTYRLLEILMATFEQVLTDLQSLKDNATETRDKLDQVFMKLDELKQVVSEAQSTGGASQEQLDQLSSLVQETSQLVQAVEDKADVA